MAKFRRVKAALNIAKLGTIGGFIVKVRGIVTSFVNNAATLGTPSPTTTVVSGHIDDLQTAEDDVQQRTAGTVTTRNLKQKIVLTDMYKWQNIVQDLADAAADEDAARNIIALSGFDIKVNGTFQKPPLAIKTTVNPGVIKLVALSAGRRSSYNWQQSTNGGTSWTELPTTLVANTTVSGLASKTTYTYRVRSITKAGVSGWSNPVSIVIQ